MDNVGIGDIETFFHKTRALADIEQLLGEKKPFILP